MAKREQSTVSVRIEEEREEDKDKEKDKKAGENVKNERKKSRKETLEEIWKRLYPPVIRFYEFPKDEIDKMSASTRKSRSSKSTSPSSRGRSRETSPKKSPSPLRRSASATSPQATDRTSPPKSGSSSAKMLKNIASKTPDLTAKGLKIIDMSGQGMTALPSSLLTVRDVGELVLASNNLRSLPPEIRRLHTLTKLDISKNGIRCTHAQDFLGLPVEMEQLKDLEELKISECNLPHVPPVIWRLTSLRYLDLSRNKINVLPPEVGNLVNLVKLNLQQTNITSLPPEIAFCQELTEITLWGNQIETLPETLPEMPCLRVMALNYRSFCGVVDSYMETLLRRGQIKSEHIPVVVFELPALECLDLESTKLNTLPDIYNHSLRELYLNKNYLQSVPSSLYNLKHLEVLDLSRNLISNLPDDIGHLHSLKVLRIESNSFERVPATIGELENLEELNLNKNRIRTLPAEIQGMAKLRTLLLEGNDLQALPEEICQLRELETLDLTNNAIHTLPLKMFQLNKITVGHSYRKLQKHGLWLYKNPLDLPPAEIWKTDKPEQIFDYLRKMQIIKTENLQRQKIMVLGASQSGKTSLTDTLALGKSVPTEGPEDTTRVLNLRPWKTRNNVEFMFFDFGGNPAYFLTYPIFMDEKALVLLVYNCVKWREEDFYETIGQWLDMLRVHSPGAVVKIVATQCDLLEEEDDFCTELMDLRSTTKSTAFSEHKSTARSDSKSEAKSEAKSEEKDEEKGEGAGEQDKEEAKPEETKVEEPQQDMPPHTETVMELIARHTQALNDKLMDELAGIENEIAKLQKATSSDETREMEEAALNLHLARERKLSEIQNCPLRVLPGVAVVSSAYNMEGLAELTSTIEHLAINRSLFPHAQRFIPQSWHFLRATLRTQASYYLLWDSIEAVATRLGITEDALTNCMHWLHNIGEVLWFHNITGLSEVVFHKPKILVDIIAAVYRHDIDEFLDYDNRLFGSRGQLSRAEFEQCRHAFLTQGQVARPLLYCLWFYMRLDQDTITDLMELLPLLDLCYSVPEPDVPDGKLNSRPLVVIPWHNQDSLGEEELRTLWPKKPRPEEKELRVVYSFPFQFPPGLFEKVSAAIQELVMGRMDWHDVIYATTDTETILLRKYDDVKVFKIVIRGQDFTEAKDLMKEFIQVVNSLLVKYPGLYWTMDVPLRTVEFFSFAASTPMLRFHRNSFGMPTGEQLKLPRKILQSVRDGLLSDGEGPPSEHVSDQEGEDQEDPLPPMDTLKVP